MQAPPQITPRILVTTDFSAHSEQAFFHALAFAVAGQARLTLLHAGSVSRRSVPWDAFPGVRETLNHWELLPSDAPRAAVGELLGLGVSKIAVRDDNPRLGIIDYLRKNPTDLLVMATQGGAGLTRLFNPSVADSVSFLTRSHTLMLPKFGDGLIDPETGRAQLRRILCALDSDKDLGPALSYLAHWLPLLGGANPLDIVFLHEDPQDAPELPQKAGQTWHHETVEGDPIERIIQAARNHDAQLIVLHTRDRLGPWGRVSGSRNDRIMRALGKPLLLIPPL